MNPGSATSPCTCSTPKAPASTPPSPTPAGRYEFTELHPGRYAVQFDLSSITDGCYPTEQNTSGNTEDQRDSDGDPDTGITHVITLTGDGDRDDTLDANGKQDAGEPGLNGITVFLLDAQRQVVAETVTDANGFYEFDDLPLGVYAVRFDLATLPQDHAVTEQNAQGNSMDAMDSDGDPETGETHFVDLNTDGQHDDTLDLGVYPWGTIDGVLWIDSEQRRPLQRGAIIGD